MRALETLSRTVRQLLASARRADGPDGPAEAPHHGSEGESEFDDLLEELGAEPSGEDPALALRDATIAELRESLERLAPLGEELGASERARLALEAEREELRKRLEEARGAAEDARAEAEEARAALEATAAENERLAQRAERAQQRLERARVKRDERHRVAVERWHELREVRGERARLERELNAARRELTRRGDAGSGSSKKADLAGLMRTDGDDAGGRSPHDAPSEARR